jgi:hypothetical protein
MYRMMGRVFYGLSIGSVALSLVLWMQRQNQPKGLVRLLWRPNYEASERVGTFVGLWAPTLAIFGKVMEDMEKPATTNKGVVPQNGVPADQQPANNSAWDRVQTGAGTRS